MSLKGFGFVSSPSLVCNVSSPALGGAVAPFVPLLPLLQGTKSDWLVLLFKEADHDRLLGLR